MEVAKYRKNATNTLLISESATLNFRNVEMNVKKKEFSILHDLIRPYFH